MIEVVLATVGCVCGVLGFLFGSAALIWTIGAARSTHRIEYQPFPDLPSLPESDPFVESDGAPRVESDSGVQSSEPKAEREAAKPPKLITSFSEIYPDIDE